MAHVLIQQKKTLLEYNSMRFDVSKPPRTGAQAHHIPCFPGDDVYMGEGSIQMNHPELMLQNFALLAISVVVCFEKVQSQR